MSYKTREELLDLWKRGYKPLAEDYANLFESTFLKTSDITEIQNIAVSAENIVKKEDADIIGGYPKLINFNNLPIINPIQIPSYISKQITFNSIEVTGNFHCNTFDVYFLNTYSISADYIKSNEISGTLFGNAASATISQKTIKLNTSRNVALTGSVSGNAYFDGSSDISITTSIPNIDGGTF